MRLQRLIFLLVMLLCGQSFAQSASKKVVLFFDTNFAPPEIKAAREAASARGETLILIPPLTSELRKELDKLYYEAAPLNESLRPLKTKRSELLKNTSVNAAEIIDNEKKITEIESKLDPINKKISASIATANPKIEEAFDSAIKSMKANNQVPTSMVFSGHSGGTTFHGLLGEVNYIDIKEKLKAYPEMVESMRSIYLWGCYTGTVGNVIRSLDAYPHLNLLAGFDDSAPASDREVTQNLLKETMIQESKLSSETDIQKTRSAFSEIKGSFNDTNAALFANGNYISKKQTIKLEDLKNQCGISKYPDLPKWQKEYEKYKDAVDKEHEDVPLDTQKSFLRNYYTFIRQNEHCLEAWRGQNYFVPSPVAVAGLVFARQVSKNFVVSMKNEIQAANAACSKHSALKFPDISKMSRQQQIKWRLGVEHYKLQCSKSKNFDSLCAYKMSDLGLWFYFINLSYGCLPFPEWVEPPAPRGLSDARMQCPAGQASFINPPNPPPQFTCEGLESSTAVSGDSSGQTSIE